MPGCSCLCEAQVRPQRHCQWHGSAVLVELPCCAMPWMQFRRSIAEILETTGTDGTAAEACCTYSRQLCRRATAVPWRSATTVPSASGSYTVTRTEVIRQAAGFYCSTNTVVALPSAAECRGAGAPAPTQAAVPLPRHRQSLALPRAVAVTHCHQCSRCQPHSPAMALPRPQLPSPRFRSVHTAVAVATSIN